MCHTRYSDINSFREKLALQKRNSFRGKTYSVDDYCFRYIFEQGCIFDIFGVQKKVEICQVLLHFLTFSNDCVLSTTNIIVANKGHPQVEIRQRLQMYVYSRMRHLERKPSLCRLYHEMKVGGTLIRDRHLVLQLTLHIPWGFYSLILLL